MARKLSLNRYRSSEDRKDGIALIMVLLMLAALLGLLLMYSALVRMERLTGNAYEDRERLNRACMSAVSRAIDTIDREHDSGTAAGYKVILSPAAEAAMFSRGTGGNALTLTQAVTQLQEWFPEPLRGSGPNSALVRAATAEWIVAGDTNDVHTAEAWVAFDVSGLLDPPPTVVGEVGRSLRENSNPGSIASYVLGDSNIIGGRSLRYTTPSEFYAESTNAWPVFMPHSLSADRGWFQPISGTNGVWITNIVVGGRSIPNQMDRWSEEDCLAVYAYLFPAQDATVTNLTVATLDFWDLDRVPLRMDVVCA